MRNYKERLSKTDLIVIFVIEKVIPWTIFLIDVAILFFIGSFFDWVFFTPNQLFFYILANLIFFLAFFGGISILFIMLHNKLYESNHYPHILPNKDKWFLFNLIEYEHLENIFSVSDEMALLGGLLDRHDEGVFSILLEYRGYWDHFVAKHSIADFEKVSDSYTSIAFIDKWDKIIGSMEHDRWLIRGDKLKVREIDNKIQKALKQFEKEYKQYEDVMLLKFYKSLAVTEEKFLKLGMGLNRELFNEMMKNNYFLRSSK